MTVSLNSHMQSKFSIIRGLAWAVLLGVAAALAGCSREAEGDQGYENLSDLANAEATAEAFVKGVQAGPFRGGNGAMTLYVSREEHGFVADLEVRESGKKTKRVAFGMYDITYDSRLQSVETKGGEVRFLYEELRFKLKASKEKSVYQGDANEPSRIYRVVLDSAGHIGFSSMLRVVKGGAPVVLRMDQRVND